MRRTVVRHVLSFSLLAFAGSAAALGLGDLRGQPVLGEVLRAEIDVLGDAKAPLDASCFRLVQPSGGDLPWLKRANLSLRKGTSRVLEIRGDAPLREPIIQLAVQMGCGNEVMKEYTLFASPAPGAQAVDPATPAARVSSPVQTQPAVTRPPKLRAPAADAVAPQRLAPRKSEKRPPSDLPDRVLLAGDGGVGEPSLRLATSLLSLAEGREAQEAKREILRLEYRMLMAMYEQATSQLATAEKLRNMEGSLAELQAKAGEVAGHVTQAVKPVEPGEAPPAAAVEAVKSVEPAPAPVAAPENPPAPAAVTVPVVQGEHDTDWLSEWSLYGILLGGLLGVGAWLGWRRYQDRRQYVAEQEHDFVESVLEVDPQRETEHEEPGGVDLPVEPAIMGAPMEVDIELDSPAEAPFAAAEAAAKGAVLDSLMSISATTLDEHFEANPVMELADIMLSFGRVKGAAQALQEYIDNNPQEALQPWIRLMDVYRMAGMREEFEAVARNLNQNFNVEIQRWDGAEPSAHKEYSLDLVLDEQVESVPVVPVAPRPTCLEDMPRIMNMICEQWHEGDVVGYLYQLLRDNRGGQRVGFALPVVEEILFLIELRETANRMEKEATAS